jgi:hypothetical protein
MYCDVFDRCIAEDRDALYSLGLAMMVSARQRGRFVYMK